MIQCRYCEKSDPEQPLFKYCRCDALYHERCIDRKRDNWGVIEVETMEINDTLWKCSLCQAEYQLKLANKQYYSLNEYRARTFMLYWLLSLVIATILGSSLWTGIGISTVTWYTALVLFFLFILIPFLYPWPVGLCYPLRRWRCFGKKQYVNDLVKLNPILPYDVTVYRREAYPA